ncbi:MAG: hypothetical protein COA57_16425 [Flavobacteriales bacterium]|nr:MAG: hypothetical protein COA57_16425 [Flavobacteriales bacterium]
MNSAILFYAFLSIFIATAILTLASLPNWIKIPNSYKKILFSTLLVEVIGCVIILFKQELLTKIEVRPNNEWIAMSINNGEFIRPEIQLTDTTMFLGKSITEVQEKFKSNEYILVKEDKAFYIKDIKNNYVGRIATDGFENAFLFNGFESVGNEIAGSDNYRKIKFTPKDNSDSWKKKGSFFQNWPLSIEVKDTARQTSYQIKNKQTGSTEYNSLNDAQDVIDKNFRKLHFFECNQAFYLIRISDANLSIKNKYITFILIRLKPKLTLN